METENYELIVTDGEKKGWIIVDCIQLEQPIGLFYSASIPYNELIAISHVDTRRIKERESHEKDDIDTLLGIQRKLDPKREKELRQYVNTYDACFPTSIILSIPERCVEYDSDNKKLTISRFEDEENSEMSVEYRKIASVLDGQHRIAGLQGYVKSENKFDVNVSIFLELDSATEAYIFSIVNQAQTKVNRSLVYDLYSLAISRSPQKLCHQIAVTLNDEDDSPFKNKIKRLGTALPSTKKVSITQAAFVESLLKHISYPRKLAVEDRDRYLRDKKPIIEDERQRKKLIFREMMIDEKDAQLTAIIWNYFTAVRLRWPNAWDSEDQGIMLSKTNGFMALMRFIKDIYVHQNRYNEVISSDDFLSILNNVDMEDKDFNTDKFIPGSSGESALYRALKESLA